MIDVSHLEVRPLSWNIARSDVQDVWDAFVKPLQDSGDPQSIEMRTLMAILRAVYAGLPEEDS
jgi:hypothetical protein